MVERNDVWPEIEREDTHACRNCEYFHPEEPLLSRIHGTARGYQEHTVGKCELPDNENLEMIGGDGWCGEFKDKNAPKYETSAVRFDYAVTAATYGAVDLRSHAAASATYNAVDMEPNPITGTTPTAGAPSAVSWWNALGIAIFLVCFLYLLWIWL